MDLHFKRGDRQVWHTGLETVFQMLDQLFDLNQIRHLIVNSTDKMIIGQYVLWQVGNKIYFPFRALHNKIQQHDFHVVIAK